MGASADVYNPVTYALHQWFSIPEYLHKMFKLMHMQVIEINAFCKDFSHQLSFLDSEGIFFNNEIIVCCYMCYMQKYALKMPLSIEIYVRCNS